MRIDQLWKVEWEGVMGPNYKMSALGVGTIPLIGPELFRMIGSILEGSLTFIVLDLSKFLTSKAM